MIMLIGYSLMTNERRKLCATSENVSTTTFHVHHFPLNLSSPVNIVNEERKVVARREFVLNPKGARCVCLWHCACFCFGSFLTTEAKSLCQEMTPKSEVFAGFYDAKTYEEIENEIEEQSIRLKQRLTMLALAAFLLALFSGKIN